MYVRKSGDMKLFYNVKQSWLILNGQNIIGMITIIVKKSRKRLIKLTVFVHDYIINN